jgi:hypothetical protein
VALMDVELGGYDRGEDLAPSGYDRRRRLIARSLDAEGDHDDDLSG